MKSVESTARDRYWQWIQAATGLLFALFVVVPLGNTLLGFGGMWFDVGDPMASE